VISVVIPTLNEEGVILKAIEALRQERVPCEILVVDGGSRDATASLVRGLGPPVRLVEQSDHGLRGRGAAYNQAACLARGDALVFLHADTRLPDGGLGLIESALENPTVIGGGFLPAFDRTGDGRARLALGLVERGWRYRSRTFRWFAGDQAPFIRRAAFFACGGYPAVRLAEDWAFAARLRSIGPVVVIDRPVGISPRRHLANGVLKTLFVTGSVEVMYRAGIESAFLARWYRHWLPRDRD